MARRSRLQFLLLVFNVTPFKIDQYKNQIHLTDKVQNLGKDVNTQKGCKYTKTLAKIWVKGMISYTRYPRECFTQIYRTLCGDAMLEFIRMSSKVVDGNQQKHLLPSFATKA